MQKTVVEAKGEVEAFVGHTILETDSQALKDKSIKLIEEV